MGSDPTEGKQDVPKPFYSMSSAPRTRHPNQPPLKLEWRKVENNAFLVFPKLVFDALQVQHDVGKLIQVSSVDPPPQTHHRKIIRKNNPGGHWGTWINFPRTRPWYKLKAHNCKLLGVPLWEYVAIQPGASSNLARLQISAFKKNSTAIQWNCGDVGVFKNRGTPKMDGLKWKTQLKWMIWGYHDYIIFGNIHVRCGVFWWDLVGNMCGEPWIPSVPNCVLPTTSSTTTTTTTSSNNNNNNNNNKEQRTKNKEQRTKNKEQRTKNKKCQRFYWQIQAAKIGVKARLSPNPWGFKNRWRQTDLRDMALACSTYMQPFCYVFLVGSLFISKVS